MDKPVLTTRQLSVFERPRSRGLPLATLPLEPDEIENVKFKRTVDDLDELELANAKIRGGWVVTLARYKGRISMRTNVYVHADEVQVPAALSALLESLQVDRTSLFWVSPLAE